MANAPNGGVAVAPPKMGTPCCTVSVVGLVTVYTGTEPPGLRDLAPQPGAAYYQPQMGIFILPYAAVRTAPSPVDALLAFLHSTYDAAANLARWDRPALEQPADVSQTPPA